MPDQVVNIIFQLGSAKFELIDFLVGGEIDFLLDAIYRVVKPMIFIEHFPEVVVRAFQAPDDLAMFRKLSQNRMMKVHNLAFLDC